MNAWVLLVLAGVGEIGWPLGFKLAETTGHRLPWIVFSALSMSVSGLLLFLAQKSIPMGTAYAVWTGIGAAGAFVVGVALFGDLLNFGRLLGAGMIVGGVIVLKTLSTSLFGGPIHHPRFFGPSPRRCFREGCLMKCQAGEK